LVWSAMSRPACDKTWNFMTLPLGQKSRDRSGTAADPGDIIRRQNKVTRL
jgi:hypothetical protein